MSSRWQELTAELAETDPEDALELLIEWGKLLPPLSPTRAALPLTDDCRVKECQTAVHLWVGVTRDGTVGGPLAGDRDESQPSAPLRVELEATVPEKSPTVRGLVALIVLGMNGMTVGEALTMPIDLLPVLKLDKVLGMASAHLGRARSLPPPLLEALDALDADPALATDDASR